MTRFVVCRRFYYETDIALNAFGNFFSAVDSFLVVVVSLEYYWFSANSPLVKVFRTSRERNKSVQVFVSRPRFTAILAALVTLAVSLTFVHLVEYETVNTIRCNGTKMFHSIKVSQSPRERETERRSRHAWGIMGLEERGTTVCLDDAMHRETSRCFLLLAVDLPSRINRHFPQYPQC